MKFWAFEATVNYIYGSILGKPKDAYNKGQQLMVSAAAGYWAGIFCAAVSHPADNLVSKLNAPTKDGVKPTVGAIVKEVGFVGLATKYVVSRSSRADRRSGSLGYQMAVTDCFRSPRPHCHDRHLEYVSIRCVRS